MDSRQAVAQAIDLMETCCCAPSGFPSRRGLGPWPDEDVSVVRDEIARLLNAPHAAGLAAQARIIWDLAVIRKQSSVWYLRNYYPVTMLIFQMDVIGTIPCARMLAGHIMDRDFPILTKYAKAVVAAPLKLCSARRPGAFADSLPALIGTRAPSHVICDWILEGGELAAARSASSGSRISFSCLS